MYTSTILKFYITWKYVVSFTPEKEQAMRTGQKAAHQGRPGQFGEESFDSVPIPGPSSL
jgi:hypothetical protein